MWYSVLCALSQLSQAIALPSLPPSLPSLCGYTCILPAMGKQRPHGMKAGSSGAPSNSLPGARTAAASPQSNRKRDRVEPQSHARPTTRQQGRAAEAAPSSVTAQPMEANLGSQVGTALACNTAISAISESACAAGPGMQPEQELLSTSELQASQRDLMLAILRNQKRLMCDLQPKECRHEWRRSTPTNRGLCAIEWCRQNNSRYGCQTCGIHLCSMECMNSHMNDDAPLVMPQKRPVFDPLYTGE